MRNLDLNSYGVQEMNVQEVKQVEGGSTASKALAVLTVAGMVMVGVGMIATGPVGIAVGIMGGAMGTGSSIAGAITGWFS